MLYLVSAASIPEHVISFEQTAAPERSATTSIQSYWQIFAIDLTEKLSVTSTKVDKYQTAFCVLLISCFFVAGCGDGGRLHYPVQGIVKFKKDDSVATFGLIEFRSESEPIVTARGSIQKDGTFLLTTGNRTGAVAGWHTVVVIQPVKDLHGKVKHTHGLDAAKKYIDHRTTDLRFEVTEDTRYDEPVILIDALK